MNIETMTVEEILEGTMEAEIAEINELNFDQEVA